MLHLGDSLRLITAYLYVTLRCNAKCGFCRIWQEQNDAPPDLPLELGRRLLDDLQRLGARYVDFTGGEPLLSAHLPDLLRHARRRGMFTSVTTNGLLYKQRAEDLVGVLDSLGFSLNGPDAATHDRVQGVGSFSRVVMAIKLAKKLKQPVHAHFTATNSSMDHLESTAELAEDLGVPLIVFPVFSYFGNDRLDEKHVDTLKRFSGSRSICLNQASLRFLQNGGNNIRMPTCTAGRSALAIAPDGSIILPCFHQKLHSVPTFGNLYETYHGDEVQRWLRASGRFSVCEGCTNWCYLNPSFVYKFGKYSIPHALSAFRTVRAIYPRNWPLKVGEIAIGRRMSASVNRS
jgi:MoaA/NifB/PqqE/SkfB family radical SAM enzyme